MDAVELSVDFEQAALLLKAICYTKIFLPPSKQAKITKRYDSLRNSLRIRFDLEKNNTSMSLSGFEFKKSDRGDIIK